MSRPASVSVVEVGLRDGLQNDPADVPTEGKLRLASVLMAAGLKELEVTSFVRPDLVPKMADAEAVAAGLPDVEGVTYSALVGNERGYDRAVAAGITHVEFVFAATDAFNERNVRRPVQQSLEELVRLCARAREDDVSIRAGIAVALGCPFSGAVRTADVVRIAEACVEAGSHELVIADTIGVANPALVEERFGALRKALPEAALTAHFHDTRGLGMANVWAALGAGVTRFDSSIAGLGGCPFAPGATGNIATEDLVNLLHGAGIETGLDLEGLFAAADLVEELVGRPSAGRVKHATRAVARLKKSA